MTEQRIAVERYLGVENAHAAIGHDDQRVDLEKAHVLFGERLVEDREQLDAVFASLTFKLQRVGELAGVFVRYALGRIDGDSHDLFRVSSATASMSMPPSVETTKAGRPTVRSIRIER